MRGSIGRGGVLALVLSLSAARPARAAEREQRPLPDYDGRKPATSRGDAALLGPRVLLAPAWAAHEYLVRRPLRTLVRIFDRNAAEETAPGWPGEGKTKFRPLVEVDVGFKPRFGAFVKIDYGRAPLLMNAMAGAAGYRFGVAQRAEVADGTSYVEARAILDRRGDAIFHGLGPETSAADRTRLLVQRGDALLSSWARFGTTVTIGAGFGIRGFSVRGPAPAAGAWASFVQHVSLVVDARKRLANRAPKIVAPRYSNGVRFELGAEHAAAPSPDRQWLTWGGALQAIFDTGSRRILGLGVDARFVDPIGGAPPPLLEHVSLGGDRLRGFLAGRLYGRSAIVATARWSWPIWAFLDAFAEVEAGNVFGAHLDGFAPRLLRLSATTGVRSPPISAFVFEVFGGIGTKPIGDGADVESGRFVVSLARPF